MKQCPRCAAVVNGDMCLNCGTMLLTVDPILKLRRKVRDALNKAPAETILKVAEFMKEMQADII